jgi:hypothetical protein
VLLLGVDLPTISAPTLAVPFAPGNPPEAEATAVGSTGFAAIDPGDVLRPLTSAQVAGMIRRPQTARELLTNLKLAWERKLLLQPRFFDDANLLKFFNGASVTWKPATPNMKPDFVIRVATVQVAVPYAKTVITVQFSHQVLNQEKVPHANSKAVHDTGGIAMSVESDADFTWGAVRSVFGAGASNQGVYAISEGAPANPPEGQALMRYLYAGDDPKKLGASELSNASFLIEQGTVHQPAPPSSPAGHDPRDTDHVKYLRIFESVKRVNEHG